MHPYDVIGWRWYVPSLGLFLLSIDLFRSLRLTAVTRDRTLRIVRDRVAAAQAPLTPHESDELMAFARQVQDVLFLTRMRSPRVPEWFFLRFRPSDRADFQVAMDELRQLARPA